MEFRDGMTPWEDFFGINAKFAPLAIFFHLTQLTIMKQSDILVLGGGVGGVAAAGILSGKLTGKARITLIDKKEKFQFPPSYPWLMVGKREPGEIQRNLIDLEKRGINVIKDDIIAIDPQAKSIRTKSTQLSGDYIIISLGAQYNPGLIEGFEEYAKHIYDLESAIIFSNAVGKFKQGTITIGISKLPFKCPAAPYEVALLLDDYFARKGIRNRIRMEFFTPELNPVPSVGPEIGTKVLNLLKTRDIGYHPGLKLSKVSENKIFFENGEQMEFDILFSTPPHQAPEPVVSAGLTDSTGWIPVDTKTLETKFPGVYAIGDVTSIPTPNGYVPYLPKAGVFAHGQAETVAANIINEILGRAGRKEWDGRGACFLETGNGRSAFMKGEFISSPRPRIDFHDPGKVWHMQKVVLEKYWLRHWF